MGLLVALSLMVVGSAFSALAADSPEQRQTFSVDLNNFDESQPYSETLHFEKDGQPVTVTLSYTPPLTRDPATEGTWKSDAFWGVAGMDYRFDLSKSGSQWKISNARDLNTYCVGGTVEDERPCNIYLKQSGRSDWLYESKCSRRSRNTFFRFKNGSF